MSIHISHLHIQLNPRVGSLQHDARNENMSAVASVPLGPCASHIADGYVVRVLFDIPYSASSSLRMCTGHVDPAIAASLSWRCRTNWLPKWYSPPSQAAIWNDLHELPAHLPRDWSHHLVGCRQASQAVACLMLNLCNMTIAADQAYQHDFGCKKRRLAIRQVERIAFSADIASFSFELLMHLEAQTFIMVFDNL